jgi:hypothetical protein
MYGMGAGFTVGAVYNMATSRKPWKIGFVSYIAVAAGKL